MTAKMSFETCGDCSGLKARVNGVLALLTVLSTLLGGVVLQGNTIRSEVAKEIARLDAQDKAVTYEMKDIKRDVCDITRRVTLLEDK
jgi:hypothetical protein